MSCSTPEEAAKIVYEQMTEPFSSILCWLLDLCIEVAANQAVNKMTFQNLAIVIAPNLFKPPAPPASKAPRRSHQAPTDWYSRELRVVRVISWRKDV